jgi:hypothetical protein
VAPVRHVLRFAAGTDPGPRSGVWRIYTHGDELYLMSRYMGGALKTSLHASGDFRHAFASEHAASFVGSGDRVIQKWDGPRGEPGMLRLLIEVVMPTDELTVPTDEPTLADKAKIQVLDPAPPGGATVVSVFLLPPGEGVDSEGKRVTRGALTLIENWRLPTRGSVLIFVSHQPHDPVGIAEARQDIAGQVGALPDEDGHRRLILLAHDHDKGAALYVDLAGELPAAGA